MGAFQVVPTRRGEIGLLVPKKKLPKEDEDEDEDEEEEEEEEEEGFEDLEVSEEGGFVIRPYSLR